MKTLICALMIMMSAQSANAADPAFSNLTASDFEKISKEFAANFAHRSVTGAATLGSIFGFELALVAGTMPSPETSSVVKAKTSGDLSNMAHAGILLGVSVPLGFSGEAIMIPKTKVGEGEIQYTSLGLKWTLDESLLVLPFNLAFRGTYSSAKFSFSQNSNGVVGSVEDSTKVTGMHILVSPKLPFVEPYLGIGQLSAKNSLGVTGTGSVFDTSYTSAQSAENSSSGTEIILGVNAKLLAFSLGLEYFQAFGAKGYTGKLGFAF